MRTHTHLELRSVKAVRTQLNKAMIQYGHEVHTGTWQGADISKRPEARMRELLNVSIHVPKVAQTVDMLQRDVEPNLPWAEDHFAERVCGFPLNPGTQWKHWPWGNSASNFLNEDGMFNHSYSERLWPRYAGHVGPHEVPGEVGLPLDNFGIRHRYGDLNDLVDLIEKDPHTRQAWAPMFFPEDTGVGDGGRKPCSLGWQFMLRDDHIHIYYPLRSCDLVRHWADDVYLAIRLGMWIRDRASTWEGKPLGSFTMHCTSLHCFVNDLKGLENA